MSESQFIITLRELLLIRCDGKFHNQKSIEFVQLIKNLCETFIREYNENN